MWHDIFSQILKMLWLLAPLGLFVLWEDLVHTMAEWRFAITTSGAQSVITSLLTLMPQ